MKLETEQLLGTLEVFTEYPCRAFFWETEEQGEFNVLNLAIANGLAQLTDVELAIESWQVTERRGTASEENYYAPEREERDNILDADTEAERAEKYQSLWQLLNSNLIEIQAFNLSAHHQLPANLEWTHPYFDVCTVLGKTDDGDWICLTPTIPDQLNFCNPRNSSYSDAQFTADSTFIKYGRDTAMPIGVNLSS